MNLEKRYLISFILLFGAVFLCAWFTLKPRTGAATFSPDGQYLLFHVDHKEGRIIYRVRKNGTELTQLTPSREDNFDPVYSPDGSKIVFARTPSGKFGEQSDLYIMNSDGSNITRLTSGPPHDSSPTFSSDGQRIYFVRARWFGRHSPFVSSSWKDKDIYSIDVDGSNLQAITDGWYYGMSRPSVSPDGKQILARAISPSPLTDEEALASIKKYEHQDSLWMIPIEHPEEMRPVRPNLQKYITEENVKHPAENPITYKNLYTPQFSLDGKSIIFQWAAETDRRGYFVYEIYGMDLMTRDVRRITNLKRNVAFPSFSPNGKEIVFLWDPKWPKRDSPYELWIIDSDGTNPRRVGIKLQ
jgi:Tol biopolymer transport system component